MRNREKRSLTLREWEVWHTYSTFFEEAIPNLEEGARRLVDTGVALAAVHRDGTALWRSADGTVKSSQVEIRTEDRGSTAKISFWPLPKEPPKSFILEALGWAAHLRFEELRLFGDYPWLRNYVRLFLGRCDFRGEDGSFSCYPVIRLYETGIILVSLRVIGPNRPVHVAEMIERFLNLHISRFTLLQIPPGLAKMVSRAELQRSRESWSIRRRARLIRLHRLLDQSFVQNSYISEDTDFDFELVPINRGKDSAAYDTLSSLALSTVDAIGYVLGHPRTDLLSIILGLRKPMLRGDFWSGRPHVHIVRHSNQADSVTQNEEQHKADFGWMMARTWSANDHVRGEMFVPENLRQFDDFGTYVNSAMSLWVWARNGLKQQSQWKDANRGYLIYGNALVVEAMEYGAMLHRQILQQSNRHGSPDQVLAARRQLALLQIEMTEISHFGEIRDTLRFAWNEMGLAGLRETIHQTLGIREAETALQESRAAERRNRLLTFAFGLTAVPAIAGELVKPLWAYLGWWRPATDEALTLLSVAISMVVVIGVIRIWDLWLARR